MSEEINQRRRRLFGTAAMTLAAAQLGLIDSVAAQSSQTSKVPPIKPGTNTSFKSIKQINARLLDVGLAEEGPANGRRPSARGRCLP